MGLAVGGTLQFPSPPWCADAAGALRAASCWEGAVTWAAATWQQKALVGEASCSSQPAVL